MTSIKRIWMDGGTMRVDELSGEDFYRQPKEASMTDKIDTSTLGRIDLASGNISSTPIEECVSTWAVDDGIQSLIADNERLRDEVQAIREALDWAANFDPVLVDQIRERALSHNDMSK